MDLESAMRETRARVEPRLEALLRDGPPTLVEAMRWAVLGGGKRLRPILCQWTHDMLEGRQPEAALDLACALELVHAYSLVHDDLPCMDDDDLRRGRPTCHVRFGEAVAVLVGDALLNLAYETILAAPWSSDAEARTIALTVAAAASHRELIGGQVLDLQSEGDDPTPDRLAAIHAAKTGALIRAAMLSGAQAARSSREVQERLGEIAGHLGLAFQITDDVLDIVGGPAELGKSPGKDADAHKMTYPALYGIEASRRMAREHAAAAESALSGFAGSERLRALAVFFAERAS